MSATYLTRLSFKAKMSDTEFYSTTVPRADTDFTIPKRYSELKMIGRGAQVTDTFYFGDLLKVIEYFGNDI